MLLLFVPEERNKHEKELNDHDYPTAANAKYRN